MAGKSTHTIATEGGTCMQSFERLCDLLQKPDCPFIDQISLSVVLDELGRYRVWAGNIGALQRGHSSLDYRLREASHVSIQVIKLLKDLNFALLEASSIVSLERLPADTASVHSAAESEIFSDVSSISGPDSDLEEDISSDESPPRTELQELFSSVVEAITNLFKLSIAIRNPSPRDRYAKSAATIPYDDKYDIGHVWQKFPYARRKLWLIDRMGKANTLRRQYFRYRGRHREKLAKETPIVEKQREGEKATTKTEYTTSSEATRSLPVESLFLGTIQSTRTTTASTYVTRDLNIVEQEEKAESVTSYATSVSDEDQNMIRLPPPPTESANEMPFECPYCFSIQTISGLNAWKRHVFNDLQPYICTFKDCNLKLFRNRHEWFEHELQSHRKEWCCNACHFTTQSIDEFERHMSSQHSESFTESQLLALTTLCERSVDKIPVADCPFCNTWEALLRKRMPFISPGSISDTLVVTPQQFRSHLGHHMEQVALFAMPRQYDDELDEGHSNVPAADYSSTASSVNKPVHITPARGKDIIMTDRAAATNTNFRSQDIALLGAATKGNAELLKTLLIEGADVSATNSSGETALHIAAKMGRKEVLQLLYENGAEIDLKDLSGSTPLHRAVDKGYEELVQMLLNKGADIDTRDLSGSNALRRAASKGHQGVMLQLLDAGADVNSTDLRGSTALHMAADKGYEELVLVLLARGADINVKDSNGLTALYRAASRGHAFIEKILLDKGADIEAMTLKGLTPLQEAASKGHEAATKTLLDYGANPDVQGARKMSALHSATYRGHQKVVEVLLDYHADANLKDDDGWPALHGATKEGVARALVRNGTGIDIDAYDNGGFTALHRAVLESREGVVRVLLENKANPKIRTKNGETALDMAIKSGHEKIVGLLMKAE